MTLRAARSRFLAKSCAGGMRRVPDAAGGMLRASATRTGKLAAFVKDSWDCMRELRYCEARFRRRSIGIACVLP